MTQTIYDVTIIGGGPIGMFSTFYSGMRDLKTKLIESRNELGGQISMFYPQKILRDIGGIPEIAGQDLVKQLTQQTQTFQPTIVFNQFVSKLESLSERIYRLTSTTGETHLTRTIVLTVGAGRFKPVPLEVKGAERFTAQTHYFIQDLSKFRDQHVVISGGGNGAVDWANELKQVAKSVTVIHRREDFTGHESSVNEMKETCDVFSDYRLLRLDGEDHYLQKVIIQSNKTGEKKALPADELIVNHGIHGSYGGIAHWGLQMENNRFVVNENMETNLPGIFAAGDAAIYPSKLKLIIGGFTEGPKAINSVKRYLDPKALEMAMYSTHHEKLLELKK
ncbi:thioredoxin reductase (NADPH) [Seinonella peptonophila]|uniref:Ferredoxin--NADP reductase n=1 Tax=Seinonella peptonophila TaxID=112248 RepID=A0A1M4X715_9BACL|nr:NAD(P)/FAD-dependent oxidoreductase [Seinonella peptonophila]SHE89266.1 thioredoxin reductase (NADPH) [Seinonella peptonophila]